MTGEAIEAMDEAREAAARAVLHRRIKDDFWTKRQHEDGTQSWAVSHDQEMANAAIDAFLSKLKETHAIVPREATKEMIIAGIAERHGQPVPEAWSLATQSIYAAMLAASPASGGE